MTNFIVQFLLKTEKYQEDILDKRFEIGREIYNSLVNVTQKRYKEMIKTKNYRNLMSKLSGDKKKDRFIWKQLNDIRKQYGMSEYSFYNDVTKIRHHFLIILTLLLHRRLPKIFGEHMIDFSMGMEKRYVIRNMVLSTH